MIATPVDADSLEDAYACCREIAKREAKNFYYAFRVLPKAKSDAMCAVYAFMRHADDIADDESKSIQLRRQQMQDWLTGWRSLGFDEPHADPVFRALKDTQQRFHIGPELLEDLVRGTSMDLSHGDGPALDDRRPGTSIDLGSGLQGYRSFDDLYHYCYLVASVVGLVCIRIFGYSNPEAELLAEKTGIAFQLTNILRDVKEDAERKRIYLPQDLLREFDVSNADLLALCEGRTLRPNERAMVVALSVQTWEYYEAARELLPMIDADSRAALWVMVEIYSGLLGQIDQRQGDVFSSRAKVPTVKKVYAMMRGAAMSMRTVTRR